MVADLLDGKPVDADYFDGSSGALTCGEEAFDETLDLGAAFDARFRRFAARPCLGWPAGDCYHWLSYGVLQEAALRLAGWLAARLEPGSRVGLAAANGVPWLLAELGCLWAGMVTVPLSEHWDDPTLVSIVKRAAVRLVFADAGQLPAVARAAASVPGLELAELDGLASLSAPAAGGVARLSSLCRDHEPLAAPRARPPEETFTILHTSGTTGLPKGAVYSNALWQRNRATYRVKLMVGFSYMPLAYITDRHTVATVLWNGGRVGIAGIAKGADKDRELFADLQLVRPTVLKGVPKFWEVVHEVASYVNDFPLRILGGRTETLICGAGALAPKVADWFSQRCYVDDGSERRPVTFIVGYGSTEAGNLAINRRLLKHVQYRLLPVDGMELGEDMGEFAVKTDHMMFGGYDSDDAKTKEAFTEDGFYRMGDVVKLSRCADGGVLVDVVGRAKTSIKLANGRWVMVESLEDLYRQPPEVRHIFLHGDSSHDRLVAVVDPEPGPGPPPDATALLAKLQLLGRQAGREPHEIVAEVHVAAESFSVAAGTLNSTGKLDRRALRRSYGAELEAMLERSRHGVELEALAGLDPAQGFREQGGTSMKAAEVAGLYMELGLPLERAVQLLMEGQGSVAEAAAAMNAEVRQIQSAAAAAALDLDADAELTEADDWAAVAPCDADGVLVTGASGFVGAHVVAELAAGSAPGRPVFCVLRENTEKGAQKKLAMTLQKLWLDPAAAAGVRCLLGDLGQPLLGLQGQLEQLRGRVGTVLHLAAKVDLVADYRAHRVPNVGGTREACRLAGALGARLLHVSTTDVLPRGTAAGARDVEVFDLALSREEAPDDKHGYGQSKWNAERVVVAAHRRGLRCSILRLGMVVGHSSTGVCMARDWVPRFLVGVAHAKAFPKAQDVHTLPRSIPVDAVARVLVALLKAPGLEGRGLTVASCEPPAPLPALRRDLAAFGQPYADLEDLSFPAWICKVETDARLSAWPILRWAAQECEFPVFNMRPQFRPSPAPPLAVELLAHNPAALAALRAGLSRGVLHAMLRYLHVGRG